MYELDTDPCPEWDFEPKSKERLFSGIAALVNNPDLSDITFIVEGKPFYAHKNIISVLSEKYKAMFQAGMLESQGKTEVTIEHIPYAVFEQIMHYLYTGDFSFKEKDRSNIDNLIDILRIADEEFLEEVKMMCEERLIKLCSMDNFVDICQVADMYNANRLKEFCAWFQRINPKVNELLYAQMQEDNSLDNIGKEKQKLNSANMFGFLDCKKM